MTNRNNMIPIAGRLHCVAEGNIGMGANEIYDDVKEVTQDRLNVAILEEKPYSLSDYSGMGRVVLKKNIVEGVNTLTQDMFYKGEVGSRVPNTNTIFVIQYDYELSENITIPSGCVLDFQGGSISGAYTLTGQNTKIIAGNTKIFGDAILLGGRFDCTYNVLWFGLVGDRTNAVSATGASGITGTDNSPMIETMLSALYTLDVSTGGISIYFPRGIYYFSREIVLAPTARNFRNWGYGCCLEIYGESRNTTELVWDIERGLSNTTRMLDLNIHDLAFQNVATDARSRFNAVDDKETYVSRGYAIKVTNPEYASKIENCFFRNWFSCVEMYETYGQFTIENCLTSRTVYGFVAISCNGINLKNNSINFAYEAAVFVSGTLGYVNSLCAEGAPFDNSDSSSEQYADKFNSVGILAIGSNITSDYLYFEFIYVGLYLKNSRLNCECYDYTSIYDFSQNIQDKITNGDIYLNNIYYFVRADGINQKSRIVFIGTYPTNIECNVEAPSVSYTYPRNYLRNGVWYYTCKWLEIVCNGNFTSSIFAGILKGNAIPLVIFDRTNGYRLGYVGGRNEGVIDTYHGTLGSQDLRVMKLARCFNYADLPAYVSQDIAEICKSIDIDGYGFIREGVVTKKTDGTETRETTHLIGGNTRPTDPAVGCWFFDPTLGKPIWYNGTAWVDATGATV